MDPWWVPAPLQGNALTRPIRVAMSKDPAGVGVHPAVADAVSRAGQWLAEAGYAVEEATPPGFAEAAADWKKIALANHSFRALLSSSSATRWFAPLTDG
jgi:amidase